MDRDLLREDQDGWSRPVTPTPVRVAILPNDDIRDLFAKWQRESEEEYREHTPWALHGDWCGCEYCHPDSEDPTLDGCREDKKHWQNPTDYGFKGWIKE